jgi:serine/threonine-protein kinase HipA
MKMKAKHVTTLAVKLGGAKVGTLALDRRNAIYFQYEQSWLSAGFDIAPYTMEFTTKLQGAPSNLFNGLHGVFSDSLPDGWGLLLMDRAFQELLGWDRNSITPLDRLAYIGHRAMGALQYEPELVDLPETALDLASLAMSAGKVLAGDDGTVLPQLLLHGGSPGGARPKVTVARQPAANLCMSGFEPLQPGFEHWIVKFGARSDPADMGRIERAYAAMAALAGVEMPMTELVHVGSGDDARAYFAVRRFDRSADERIHMLSLSGHLYASHRAPSLDYETILAATHRITGSTVEVAKAFRLMVFNALAYNRDDHSKNFAYLFREGRWLLSPAFDLTHSFGMHGQHTSAVNGRGNPTREDVLAEASKAGIADAEQVIDEVATAVGRWRELAGQFGVNVEEAKSIGSSLDEMQTRIVPSSKPTRPSTSGLAESNTPRGQAITARRRPPS